MRCDLDILLRERRRLRDERDGRGRHEHRRGEKADEDERNRGHVKEEASRLQLGRALGQQPLRRRHPDVGRCRGLFALPPPADRGRCLGLGWNAFAFRADRTDHGKAALRSHLLDRRVVADDRHALPQPRGVVAQQLEVEAALSDA